MLRSSTHLAKVNLEPAPRRVGKRRRKTTPEEQVGTRPTHRVHRIAGRQLTPGGTISQTLTSRKGRKGG